MAANGAEAAKESFILRIAEDRKAIFQGAGGLGKWVFATLVLINAGALLAIAGRAGATTEVIAAGQPFVWGVVAGVLSGCSAWWVLLMLAQHLTPLVDRREETVPDAATREVVVWVVVTAIMAIAALACFTYGAISVGAALQDTAKPPPSPPQQQQQRVTKGFSRPVAAS